MWQWAFHLTFALFLFHSEEYLLPMFFLQPVPFTFKYSPVFTLRWLCLVRGENSYLPQPHSHPFKTTAGLCTGFYNRFEEETVTRDIYSNPSGVYGSKYHVAWVSVSVNALLSQSNKNFWWGRVSCWFWWPCSLVLNYWSCTRNGSYGSLSDFVTK